MKKRRIEITSVCEQTVWLRSYRRSRLAWCPECGQDSIMLAPDETARLARVNTRVLHRWVDAGEVHFSEEPDGLLLLCLVSVGDARERAVVEAVA